MAVLRPWLWQGAWAAVVSKSKAEGVAGQVAPRGCVAVGCDCGGRGASAAGLRGRHDGAGIMGQPSIFHCEGQAGTRHDVRGGEQVRVGVHGGGGRCGWVTRAGLCAEECGRGEAQAIAGTMRAGAGVRMVTTVAWRRRGRVVWQRARGCGRGGSGTRPAAAACSERCAGQSVDGGRQDERRGRSTRRVSGSGARALSAGEALLMAGGGGVGWMPVPARRKAGVGASEGGTSLHAPCTSDRRPSLAALDPLPRSRGTVFQISAAAPDTEVVRPLESVSQTHVTKPEARAGASHRPRPAGRAAAGARPGYPAVLGACASTGASRG